MKILYREKIARDYSLPDDVPQEESYTITLEGSRVTEEIRMVSGKKTANLLMPGAAGYAITRRFGPITPVSNGLPDDYHLDEKLRAVVNGHPRMHWSPVMSQAIHQMAGFGDD